MHSSFPKIDKCVATTGFFDGVHLGHVAVLQKVLTVSRTLGIPSVVITFWPHPRILLKQSPEKLRLLSTLAEKEEQVKRAGIDHFLVLPFTFEFSSQTAEEFIRNYLVKRLNVQHLIVGYDHHIGRGGTTSYLQIKEICSHLDIEVEQLAPSTQETIKIQPKEYTSEVITEDVIISSSKIRDAIEKGQMQLANSMLGYTYSLSGTVVHGHKLGRQIGYPTANIVCTEELKLIPAVGVYAVRVEVGGQLYGAMLYIGHRPTINSTTSIIIEAHIFHFNTDIYDETIRIYFEEYVRGDVKFDRVDDLRLQLDLDAHKCETIIKNRMH